MGTGMMLPCTGKRSIRSEQNATGQKIGLTGLKQKDAVEGIWMITDPQQTPDVVVYYAHGGGFSMGSSYFYIEFLLAWVSLLKQQGFANPALFALDYTLVPQASYPTQLDQAKRGYDFVLSRANTSTQICLSGDSAGATLTLSLLLALADHHGRDYRQSDLAILISPWPIMQSRTIGDTSVDFLNVETLYQYGRQYVGTVDPRDPLVSPGCCSDLELLRRACPKHGFAVLYGRDEVLAPDIQSLIKNLERVDSNIHVHAEMDWAIHAWPVVKLYLGSTERERYQGLKEMAAFMRSRLPIHSGRTERLTD